MLLSIQFEKWGSTFLQKCAQCIDESQHKHYPTFVYHSIDVVQWIIIFVEVVQANLIQCHSITIKIFLNKFKAYHNCNLKQLIRNLQCSPCSSNGIHSSKQILILRAEASCTPTQIYPPGTPKVEVAQGFSDSSDKHFKLKFSYIYRSMRMETLCPLCTVWETKHPAWSSSSYAELQTQHNFFCRTSESIVCF